MDSNADFSSFLPTVGGNETDVQGSTKMKKPTVSGRQKQVTQKQPRQQFHPQNVKRRIQPAYVPVEENDIPSSQVLGTEPFNGFESAFYPGAVGVVSQNTEPVVDERNMLGNLSSNNWPRKHPTNDILISESQDFEVGETEQQSVKNFLKGRNAASQGVQPSVTQTDSEMCDDNGDITDEEELAQRFQSAALPTVAEIKRTQVFTLSELQKDHVYMVLGGHFSDTSFENEFGETEKGQSIIVKVVDTASPDIGSRLRVRLTGMSYERLVNQSRYMDYISSDDYFFLYEGMIESKLNPGYKYHRISVRHAPHGTKNWRNDYIESIPAAKKRKM